MCSAFCLVYFPSTTGSLSVKADSTVSLTSYRMKQSSRGSERVPPRGFRKVQVHNLGPVGQFFPSSLSQQPQTSAAIIFTASQLRGAPMVFFPLPRALTVPSPHPPDTTSSSPPVFTALHTLPLLCKDAAQGCNKIHTKVIFHKEKKLRNNCSSNAQQASDSWLPAWGALVMCS